MTMMSGPAPLAPMKALHTGSGDPLLLLHGFMLSPHCWESVAQRLSSTCEVYAPAFRGHWGGPELDGWYLDVAVLADQIEQQLDELGWRTCHIAGNSLGGWVGFELARRGRARTLTAIAPAGGWASPSLLQIRVGVKFLSLVPVVEIGKRLGDAVGLSAPARQLAAMILSRNTSAVPRRLLEAALTSAMHCPAMLPVLVSGLRMPALGDLSTLRTPVRLLMCEHDRVIPNQPYAQRFLRELPESADRILVHGVGHVPMLEAPDRIATLIAEHVYASRSHLRAV
ncbi:alpha/beta fold hydrolase [Nocardia macrotermitis]|uniref:2-succinyl-6-hydroxy-2, 4-cyclohexadiene-1-carboxylate synthase n=1 Tax=Nocardia macrotermitis TaxID=2585198 RepID=A0A7K0DG59_9NOCA|nr:alpha/beta hydrolase [Nocardia macrotermitis]MQY24292.1 2-succinyl-6-hydroxy-2,4-cyclohexadiene-1-carboxylate synthase [Nocardia macrotermitis]